MSRAVELVVLLGVVGCVAFGATVAVAYVIVGAARALGVLDRLEAEEPRR